MRYRVVSRVVFGIAILPQMCSAQDSPRATQPILDPAWLRTKLTAIAARHHLPSLAAALVVNDRIVAASAVGVRRWGSTDMVTRDDAYHLGSVAKPLTATMIARLVDLKKLRWDTTIAHMFPELTKTMNPAYRGVTVAQLLSHSSGMPYQPRTPESVTDGRGKTVADKRYEYVKAAVADPPEAPPGTKVIYSGGGVIVASYLERSTHKTYEQLMSELVFEPLGMTTAGFGAQATPGGLDRIDGVWDHELKGSTPVPVEPRAEWAEQARAPVGRNVHCSVIDLARFSKVHLVPGGYLSRASIAVLHSPVSPVDYAPGWALGQVGWAKGRILWHSGSMGRNHALVHVVPEERFATCVLTNIDGERVHAACDEVNLFLVERVHQGLRSSR
jgi:CubicO group peptidase (beta-lactamase class C family)